MRTSCPLPRRRIPADATETSININILYTSLVQLIIHTGMGTRYSIDNRCRTLCQCWESSEQICRAAGGQRSMFRRVAGTHAVTHPLNTWRRHRAQSLSTNLFCTVLCSILCRPPYAGLSLDIRRRNNAKGARPCLCHAAPPTAVGGAHNSPIANGCMAPLLKSGLVHYRLHYI